MVEEEDGDLLVGLLADVDSAMERVRVPRRALARREAQPSHKGCSSVVECLLEHGLNLWRRLSNSGPQVRCLLA
jgi:hypothetical protein